MKDEAVTMMLVRDSTGPVGHMYHRKAGDVVCFFNLAETETHPTFITICQLMLESTNIAEAHTVRMELIPLFISFK